MTKPLAPLTSKFNIATEIAMTCREALIFCENCSSFLFLSFSYIYFL